jgi:hypothetical protein
VKDQELPTDDAVAAPGPGAPPPAAANKAQTPQNLLAPSQSSSLATTATAAQIAAATPSDDFMPAPPAAEAPAAGEPSAKGPSQGATMAAIMKRGSADANAGAPGGTLDPAEIGFWHAARGDSLHKTLTAWSDQSHVRLYWSTPNDYKLPSGFELHGNFTDAVNGVLGDYASLTPRPVARLYAHGPENEPVLIVKDNGKAVD